MSLSIRIFSSGLTLTLITNYIPCEVTLSTSQIFKSNNPNSVLLPYQFRENTTKRSVIRRTEIIISSLLPGSIFVCVEKLPVYLQVLYCLQYCFGLRIGEVLSIISVNCSPDGFIRIVGSKKSNNRIIFFPIYAEIMKINHDLEPYQVCKLSYRAYYLHLMRLGLYFKIDSSRKNNSVTHAARHNRIHKLLDGLNATDSELSEFIGHKSKSAIKYYKKGGKYNEE